MAALTVKFAFCTSVQFTTNLHLVKGLLATLKVEHPGQLRFSCGVTPLDGGKYEVTAPSCDLEKEIEALVERGPRDGSFEITYSGYATPEAYFPMQLK